MSNYTDFCREMFFMKIAVLEKIDNKFTPTCIEDIEEHAGVWLMWGKKHSDDDYTCLEVGESQTIIYELYIDISLLNYGLSQFVFLKDTSNVPCRKLSEKFGNFSKQFYKVNEEERRTAKYRDIAVNYDNL